MRLKHIDHIAMRVRNLQMSVAWYKEVLGLRRRHAEWEEPVMLGIGGTNLALFEAERPRKQDRRTRPSAAEGGIRLLHIAFRADRKNFHAAQRELRRRRIPFHFEDHGLSHSIYFTDPDGHQLEVTTYEV